MRKVDGKWVFDIKPNTHKVVKIQDGVETVLSRHADYKAAMRGIHTQYMLAGFPKYMVGKARFDCPTKYSVVIQKIEQEG